MRRIHASLPAARASSSIGTWYAGRPFGWISAKRAPPIRLFVIRTVVVRDGWAHVQAGAGIVHDSDPESEYNETLHKASAVVQAIRAAHRAHGELGSIEASLVEEKS